MHVRIDEARRKVGTAHVELLAPLVRTEAGHEPLDDRDVGLEPLFRENREHLSAAQHQIRGLVASGDRQPARIHCSQRGRWSATTVSTESMNSWMSCSSIAVDSAPIPRGAISTPWLTRPRNSSRVIFLFADATPR